MSDVETTFFEKEVFRSMKEYEEKIIKFEELLKNFSKDLVTHNADILVSSFGFYKNESFKTLSNSWDKKECTEEYNNIVNFFDKGIKYLNEEKALSLTRYIFDNDIQCLKILASKDNANEETEESSFKTLHIPIDGNSSTLDAVNNNGNFNETINAQSIDESIWNDTLLKEEKEPFKKIAKVYKQYLCCRNNDVVYFLNPQHQINGQKIALILICNTELSNQDLYKIMIFFRAIVSEELYEKIQEAATRAAISQVMARNTSHNIGAHVMNKLIGDLSKLIYKDFKNYVSTIDIYNGETDNNKILLDQITLFNNYVKCRMDYLADISFGTPLMQTNKYAYSELFKDLDKVRLLLEHISGLDKFQYEIQFKRNGKKFKANDGDQDDLLVAIPNDILGTQAFYNIMENIIRNTAKHSNQKPDTTVFTVNFIDDFEKIKNDYTDTNRQKEIENILNDFIAVEVYDNIPVEKTDEDLNLSDDDKKEFTNKKTPLPADNKFPSYVDKLVFTQNKKLNEDILHENKLRSSSLGLVEMDASAAYLRKRPVEYINHTSYDIQYDESWSRDTEINNGNQAIRGTNCRHFLKAFKKENVSAKFTENGTITTQPGNALAYRFFLLRPAVVLVVTNLLEDAKDDTAEKKQENKDKKEKLKKEGIGVVTKKDFEKDLKAGKVYPHEFVLIDNDVQLEKVKMEIATNAEDGQKNAITEEIDFLDYYKTSLPIRILQEAEGMDTIKNLLSKSANEIEECCWRMWGNKLLGAKKVRILKEFKTIDIYKDVFQAVFLDHLYSSNKTDEQKREVWIKNLKAFHLEALSSNAQSKMPDFTKIIKKYTQSTATTDQFKDYLKGLDFTNATNNPDTYRKVIEAVLTKIIVIDERIQEAAENRDFMTIPFKCLYRKMNVIVPVKESLDLSANTLSDIKPDIEKYIERKIKKSNPNDFILIHYSILERIYDKTEINTKLNEWAKSINVVVTSGRGIPDSLTSKVRFVNLSSVITAFIDIRNKYVISYLLNSSRKSNKI